MDTINVVDLSEYGDRIEVYAPETFAKTVLVSVEDSTQGGSRAVITLTPDEATKVAFLLLQGATILRERGDK